MEEKYGDGSSGVKEMTEMVGTGGRGIRQVSGANYGDHFLIDAAGHLQIRDQEGLIFTAKKIE